jgi:cell pole-organizing protein PopZ
MSSDKTAEPSMDEILSSIRKIITEDSTSRPSPTASAVPLPPAMKADFGSPSSLPPPPRPPVLKPPAVDDVLDELSKDVKAMRATLPSAPPLPPAAPPLSKPPLPGNSDANVPLWQSPRASEPSSAVPPGSAAERAASRPAFGMRDADAEIKAPPVLEKRSAGDLGGIVPSRMDASPSAAPKADLLPHERVADPEFGRVAKPETTGAGATPPLAGRTPPTLGAATGQMNGNHFSASSASATQPEAPRSSPIASDAPAKPINATPTATTTTPGTAAAAASSSALPPASNASDALASPGKAVDTGPAKSASPATLAPTPNASVTAPKPPAAETPAARPSPPTNGAPAQARPAASPGSTSPASRTMEETVVELLRPMLRQWLDANMPRIVEKSLKAELADPSKKKD